MNHRDDVVNAVMNAFACGGNLALLPHSVANGQWPYAGMQAFFVIVCGAFAIRGARRLLRGDYESPPVMNKKGG